MLYDITESADLGIAAFCGLIAVASNKETVGEAVESIMHTIGRFGMKKFAGAVMYVLQTVLDPPKFSQLGEDFEDWQKRWPWMICEPNEKEGKLFAHCLLFIRCSREQARSLLNEIMLAGNFGAFDQRIKRGYGLWIMGYGFNFPKGMVHAIEKTKHNLRLLTHYPEEVLCEPFFRLYHYLWRKLELWRW